MAESSVAGLLAADSDSVHISPTVSNRNEEEILSAVPAL